MKTINFSKVREGEYISESFAPESDAISVRVEFEARATGNALIVERSITGQDWVTADVVTGYGFDGKAVEFGVDGIVAGQQLRLVAGSPASAKYIG